MGYGAAREEAPRRFRERKTAFPHGDDPYLSWGERYGTAVCRICSSVYHKKRWSLPEGPPDEITHGMPRRVICPACRKIEDGFAGGSVSVEGDFVTGHKEEILHRVRHEERRAKAVNPLERIMAIKETNGHMEILTTNEKLAQRIGRELQRAFKGAVRYQWSRDDKQVRVWWSRWMEAPHDGA